MFSFLAEILAITFLGFGAIYPLLLWLSPYKLIQGGFYRFNQGMVSIIISIGIIFIYLSLSLDNNFFLAILWLFIQLFVTAIFWKTKYINNIFLSIPSIVGIVYLTLIMNQVFLINLVLLDKTSFGTLSLANTFFNFLLTDESFNNSLELCSVS